MLQLLDSLKSLNSGQWARTVLDIAVVSYLLYRLILLAKGRRAWWILIGLGAFFFMVLVSDRAGLVTLNWILRQITPLGPVAILLIFYPELRELLEKLGRGEFFGTPLHVTGNRENVVDTVEEVVNTATLLSPRKTGALIVMERETGLDDVIANGTPLDAEVTSQLLATLFYNGTPLHDGAVIVRQGRIAAAGCTLPLSDAPNIAANVHMRHRAALGVSETSDAVVVIVSEETGTISLAMNGKLNRGLKSDSLRSKLLEAYGVNSGKRSSRSSVRLPFIRRSEDKDATPAPTGTPAGAAPGNVPGTPPPAKKQTERAEEGGVV